MLGWSEARTVPGQTDRKEGDQGNHGNGCNIQVSIHLSLKFLGQHIYQRGYITSSTAPILGLGHNMGCFPPFCIRIYTNSTSFFRIQKSSQKVEITMSCTRLYVGSTKR